MGEAADDRGIRRRGLGMNSLSLRAGRGKFGVPMQRTKPPFRADHVGSLLRTAPLKEAREKRKRGEISADALTEIEDREIESVIRKQEAVGLKSITDGEYRRISWNYDFLERLDNVESYAGERKIKFAATGPQPRPILLRVIGKLGGYKPHPMIEHFKFLKAHTRQTPKLTIPSPSSLHFRYGRDAVPESIYPSMDDFYRDLGETYRKVGARVRRCRLPLSPARRGQPRLSVRSVAAQADCRPRRRSCGAAGDLCRHDQCARSADIPSDMTITMHLCRGNFRSSFVASAATSRSPNFCSTRSMCTAISWSTTPTAPAALNRCALCRRARPSCSGWSPRSPARWRRRTSIKRRIDEAAKFVDLDQLCLSPQCGFASTEEGNALAEDEEWAKLRMIVEIAEEVWGK